MFNAKELVYKFKIRRVNIDIIKDKRKRKDILF